MTYNKEERREEMEIERLEDAKSNCCQASIIEDSDICSDCKEHCEAFNLSEKAENNNLVGGLDIGKVYWEDDIKEFIRLLKEEVENSQYDYANLEHVMKDKVIEIIDKLVGDKLK